MHCILGSEKGGPGPLGPPSKSATGVDSFANVELCSQDQVEMKQATFVCIC